MVIPFVAEDRSKQMKIALADRDMIRIMQATDDLMHILDAKSRLYSSLNGYAAV